MSDQEHFNQKKFSATQLAVNGGATGIGSAAAVFAVSGPIWLAVGIGLAAGAAGVLMSNEVPKK